MTDFYSYGLLIWKISLDGINPFEKLGIIPTEWSEDAQLKAVRFLKESDCVSSLYRESLDKDTPKSIGDNMAGCLMRDPIERRKALEETARVAGEFVAGAIQRMKAENDNSNPDTQLTDIIRVLEDAQGQLTDDADSSETEDEEQDPFELLSFGSLLSGRSFVPDCVSTFIDTYTAASQSPPNPRLSSYLKSIRSLFF